MSDQDSSINITTPIEEDEYDRLTLPNGFAIDGEEIVVSVAFDGHSIIFRGEDGDLYRDEILCYIMRTAERFQGQGNMSAQDIAWFLVSYFHDRWHSIQEQAVGGLQELMEKMASGATVLTGEDAKAALESLINETPETEQSEDVLTDDSGSKDDTDHSDADDDGISYH